MANNWSADQTATIVDDAWQNGVARCPDDGSLMKVVRSDAARAVVVICPRCDQRVFSNQEMDPRSGEFRNWTEGEKQAALDEHFIQGMAVCPVDGTPLHAITSGSFLRLLCKRCDRFVNHQAG